MKPLTTFLSVGIAFLGAAPLANASSLLTFDELPTPEVAPGINYDTIPNGYGNLLWNQFGVSDASLRPPTEGYRIGMISPRNVAFNLGGSPASISAAGGCFDLNSAYFTMALYGNTPLDLQVQGFLGTTLLYDHTYTVYRSAPTFIDFGYLGVDKVTFTPSPSNPFAMDNLTVTVPEPGTLALLIFSLAWFVVGSPIKRHSISSPLPSCATIS